MSRHTFGRTIDFRLTLLEGRETEVVPYSLVSARIYADYPTDVQIADAGSATTGHVERVTSWTTVNFEGTGRAEQQITFAPIADPDPTAAKSTVETYYVAVNFKYSSAGATVSTVEQIYIHRPNGLTEKIRVTADDVIRLDSTIAEVAPSVLWIEDKIDAAIEYVLAKLAGQGYDKARLFDLAPLNAPTRRLAYSYCCFALGSDGSTVWFEKGKLAREEFETLFASAKVSYDVVGDDQPAEDSKITTGAVHTIR